MSLPEDNNVATKEFTKDDMLDYLNQEDDSEVDKKEIEEESKEEPKEEEEEEIKLKGEEKEEEKEEEPEEEEIKLKDETEEEEKLELNAPVSRKKILAAFPELFKKFPFIETAIYRNYKYSEILPTIDDAKEAVAKSEILDKFEHDLLDGNTEKVLNTVKTNHPDSFSKIVDNYLPTLAKVDKDAYYHVLSNVVKTVIVNMVQEGKKIANEDLQNAASIVNQFMFGTSDFQPPTKLARDKTEDKERLQLQSEREQFIREKFEAVRGDLDTRVENVLKSTIDDHIDPKSVMTSYVKRNATREAFENLEALIEKDAPFKANLERLWEKAFDDKFSKPSLDRIRSAYLSKAKTLLPTVIQKARNEALKGLGKRVSDDDNKDKRGPITPGRSTASNRGKITDAKSIPKGMSSYDFLSQE
jgi:hypothetical protein